MLGPLEVLVNGLPVSLGGAKQRATLGFLLLQVNRVVAVSELQEALWAYDEAPPTARKVLQNAVWGLRGLLPSDDRSQESAKVVTQAPGYMLQVDPERVDLHQFQRKVEQGRSQLAAGAPDQAARLLGDALALWRGPALADLVETGIAWPGLAALQSAKLDVMEDYFEAQLACGRDHEVLGELSALVSSEPFRERSCGQLMLALYRCGRQVEALDAYSRLRSVLARELGLEPSPELRSLQGAILTHELAVTPDEIPRPPEPRIEVRAQHSEGTGAILSPRWSRADPSAFTADETAGVRETTAVAKDDPAAPPVWPAQRTPAERRYVSILLIRSQLAREIAQLDASEIDDVLEGVAVGVQDKVEHHGGAVALAVGPLSLAAFGLADTEGCEERAVRAAVAIRDHVIASAERAGRTAFGAPGPRLSLAVVTGEALVRQAQGGGTPPSVFGALVERCQTLLSSAPGGEILVCDRTRRATDATIAYRPGGSSPGDWRVEGVRGVRDLASGVSMISHEVELNLAHGLLERTRLRRTTHLITVLGEPGAGKTQFLEQFRGGWTRGPESLHWLMSHIPPFAGNDAVPVLRNLLSTLCGILPEDPPATVYGRLSAALHQWSDFESERRWLTARLGGLFGLKSAESIEFGNRDVLEACEKMLTNVAFRQPVVLVLDDVHRAQDSVLDFIEGLTDLPVPLFVIAAGRPELLQRRPEWGGGKRHRTIVTLTPPVSFGQLRDYQRPGHRGSLGGSNFIPADQGDGNAARPAIGSSMRSVLRAVPASIACPRGEGDDYVRGEGPVAG
jgi:DNA-binding SARP family transcriptional activator/class 3 adenylate cyclase